LCVDGSIRNSWLALKPNDLEIVTRPDTGNGQSINVVPPSWDTISTSAGAGNAMSDATSADSSMQLRQPVSPNG
jgi:hypothetical protein